MQNQQKVYILGGSGFIGTRLGILFRKINRKFTIVDKAPSKQFPSDFLIADVRSLDALMEAINSNVPSLLINLAAEHRDNVYPTHLYDAVNVTGAKNVCQVASSKNINTIIFTSSVAVYGFAKLGTNELGAINPFNDYGRTKFEAEEVYKKWQAEDPQRRTLVIVRPTVVFGEQNRGNVYNLLRQIASGRFVMVGKGENRKSMAYVENLVAFLSYSLEFKPGVHLYNYIDKPDFSMNQLVKLINQTLGRSTATKVRIPLFIGLLLGRVCDLFSLLTGKNYPVSAIRVKKFCADSVYESSISNTGFSPPVLILDAIEKTVRYEFLEDHKMEQTFYSE